MMHRIFCVWLATAALSLAVACGCSHSRRATNPCSCSTDCGTTVAATCSVAEPPAIATTVVPAETGATQATLPKAVEIDSFPIATIIPVASIKETVRRRSYMDLTANSCFDHAEDYTWLAGELRFEPARQSWKLRYASAEEGDRYGGTVTIVGIEAITDAKSGNIVRVEGRLDDSNRTESQPVFRVTSMKTVEPPPWEKP